MPLPGTRLIHPLWTTRHQPTAAKQCNADCVITRPDTSRGTYDPTTGKTTRPSPATVYIGRCRVQALAQEAGQVQFGGQQVTLADYRVSLPLDGQPARVETDDLVTITGVDDPAAGDLARRLLRVLQPIRGSLLWQTDLRCQLTDEGAPDGS